MIWYVDQANPKKLRYQYAVNTTLIKLCMCVCSTIRYLIYEIISCCLIEQIIVCTIISFIRKSYRLYKCNASRNQIETLTHHLYD